MASASDRQNADSSLVSAAAGGVAAVGMPARAAAAGVLAHTTASEPESRHGFVDMLLSTGEPELEPLVAWELKRPAVIPVSAEQPAPDAAACWKQGRGGGALSSYSPCIAANPPQHALGGCSPQDKPAA